MLRLDFAYHPRVNFYCGGNRLHFVRPLGLNLGLCLLYDLRIELVRLLGRARVCANRGLGG